MDSENHSAFGLFEHTMGDLLPISARAQYGFRFQQATKGILKP
jgi:hypothetical protein